MANSAAVSYPTLVPTPAIGGGVGLPPSQIALSWADKASDQTITGALKINPAYAGEFFSGNFLDQSPRNNQANAPSELTNKVVSQAQATSQSDNAWKKRTQPATSNAVRFGDMPAQAPFAKPWNKKFIPPLALFNDASQVVNTLLLNRPGDRHNNGSSDPPLTAQYFTPPPVQSNNFAAGALNLQLQLGTLAIQAQQLTISASTYFGGS